jgi:hypothetical protein
MYEAPAPFAPSPAFRKIMTATMHNLTHRCMDASLRGGIASSLLATGHVAAPDSARRRNRELTKAYASLGAAFDRMARISAQLDSMERAMAPARRPRMAYAMA